MEKGSIEHLWIARWAMGRKWSWTSTVPFSPLFFSTFPLLHSQQGLHLWLWDTLWDTPGQSKWLMKVQVIDKSKSSCDKSGPSNQSSLFSSITLLFNIFIKTDISPPHTHPQKQTRTIQHFPVAPLPPGPSEMTEYNDFFQDNNYKTLNDISIGLCILFKYLSFSDLT